MTLSRGTKASRRNLERGLREEAATVSRGLGLPLERLVCAYHPEDFRLDPFPRAPGVPEGVPFWDVPRGTVWVGPRETADRLMKEDLNLMREASSRRR